jgi:hypothetical protein
LINRLDKSKAGNPEKKMKTPNTRELEGMVNTVPNKPWDLFYKTDKEGLRSRDGASLGASRRAEKASKQVTTVYEHTLPATSIYSQ